ncbi:MAG: DUF4351 domain-containing protein [Syntrophomonadaceae bacterium]|nr:DUF4351 domain-containing protein [Syntrophomonadaceae bacterium]MDD3898596.1 DUF4351 domain-containing protein [Syntrophomonadaceae bacterium]
MSYESRPQAYDETIRVLEQKDHRGIAEFILPAVKNADEITLGSAKLSIPDMREVDYLARVKLKQEDFVLHIEFESAYKSNTEMQKRMLRYYTYIKWHNDLPIYQVLVVLKKPPRLKNIVGSFKSTVQDMDVMQYQYKVIKAYEIDKYEVLKEKQVVLYPLRIFMKHEGESEEEHIQECLTVVEALPDSDYYFLLVECLKKLYEKGKYEKIVKEEIYMSSILYKEPYETGRREEKVKILIKFLGKRFGALPAELKKKIEETDTDKIDTMLDEVLDYDSLEEVKKYIQ